MHRFSGRALMLLMAILAMSACNNNPIVTAPTPGTPQTDVYSGTLSKNGAFTHAFSISTLGSITTTIVSLAPNAAQIVGLQLGVWNGVSCTAASSTDVATTGSSITLNASSAGIVCVRLYDVGFVGDPVLYQLQVVHP
jgi:ABC-type Fe3+-hydroxamate transport system substrate-binding protein